MRALLLKLSPQQIIGFFLLLATPIIYSGYQGDDYFHQLILNGLMPFPSQTPGSIFGLFSFVHADSQNHQQLMMHGALPWWAGNTLHFIFWRPLAELSLWLDHLIAPNQPVLANLQSILWFIALAFLLRSIFLRLGVDKLTAFLAFIVFVLYCHHAGTIELIANRNALMSGFFGFLAFYWHLLFRQSASFRYLLLALASLFLAAASGESAFALGGFFFAYAILLDKSGPAKGFLMIVPYGLLMLLWLGLYRYLGYGAGGSSIIYLDPHSSPLLFIQVLVERLLSLVFSGFGIVPAEALFASKAMGDTAYKFYIAAISSALIILFAALTPLIKQNKVLQFSLLAAIIALLPVATVIPQSRLLLIASAGFCLFIAIVITHIFSAKQHRPPHSIKAVAIGFILLHLIISPALFFKFSYDLSKSTISLEDTLLSIDDQHLKDKHVLLLNTSITESALLMPLRLLQQHSIPKQVTLLTSSSGALSLERISNKHLRLSRERGFVSRSELAFRDLDKEPFAVGDNMTIGAIRLSVTQINQHKQPLSIDIQLFDVVDDYRLLLSKNQQFISITLPAIGEIITIE